MKFWEGAVIVVGGIWLIGRISRTSADHPVNIAAANGAGSASTGVSSGVGQSGVTTGTNTDGSDSLVPGETLLPAPPIIGSGAILTPGGTISAEPPAVMSSPDPGCSTCGGVGNTFPIPLLQPRPIISSGARPVSVGSSLTKVQQKKLLVTAL